MIGIVDIQVQAQFPNLPLPPFQAFVSSPSSVRVRNVPRRIGKWEITSVAAVVVYPDGETVTANCVLHGGVWVGTVSGCGVSGRTENGFTVYASGTDENGDAVSNYVLGKGDVVIYEADGELKPNEPFSYVHLLSAESAAPHDGDMYPLSGNGYAVYQNGAAHTLGATLSAVFDEEWAVTPFPNSPYKDLNVFWGDPDGTGEGWYFDLNGTGWEYSGSSDPEATRLGCEYGTAERGFRYVLGGQTDKPLAPAGDYTTAAQVSAIVESYLNARGV